MKYKKKLIHICAAILIIVGTLTGMKQTVKADVSTRLYINHVDSIDNTQYPETSKFVSLSGMTGRGVFTVTKPTIVKAYMTWDTVWFRRANLWFSRDPLGIDLVGEKKTLDTVSGYTQYLLDPGDYYLNYSMEAKDNNNYVMATVGLCLMGQEVQTNESYYSSSFLTPNILESGVNSVGFLSVTSPIDYYKFSVREKSIVTIQYDFSQLMGVKVTEAQCCLLNSEKAMIATKRYSTNGIEDNKIIETLEPGVYYISMSGAQTVTTIKYTTVSYRSSGAVDGQKIPTLDINYVNYIDNALYPETSKFTSMSGLRGAGKIKIKKPSVVRAYMSWNTDSFNSATIWFSRDKDGMDIIGTTQNIASNKDYIQYLLDPGTYYVNYSIKSNSNSSTVVAAAGLCVSAQSVKTTEDRYVSSWTKPNNIAAKKSEIGFLSITAPIDYYKFKIKSKSRVTIQFDFNQLQNVQVSGGECKVMNADNMLITSKMYSTRGIEDNTFSVMLEPGSYYIMLSGAQTITTLKYTAVSYVVKGTTQKVGKKAKIKLSIPFEPAEIMVRKGNVSNTKMNDINTWSTWSQNCTILEGRSYYVTKNGVYTFRITDVKGYQVYYKVKVSNLK